MTALELQDDLVAELERMFKQNRYRRIGEENRVPLQVFPQALPIQETDDDEEPVPYIIVRLSSGEDPGGADSFNTVKLVIIIGIWDDDLKAQGHRDVMNIISKIYERFSKDPFLNHRSVYTGEFHWMLQEDGYFPYHFGACSLSFNIAAIRRENKFT